MRGSRGGEAGRAELGAARQALAREPVQTFAWCGQSAPSHYPGGLPTLPLIRLSSPFFIKRDLSSLNSAGGTSIWWV